MTNTDYTSPLEGGAEALVAFAQALGAVENVAKTQTADTGKYSYRYADLGDVLDECKRACSMFGLALTQNATVTDGMFAVSTSLIHAGTGQWLSFPPIMLRQPADAQALGSAMTYLRRYALLSIFGIAPDDDDGRAATQAARQAQSGFRSEAERMFIEHMEAMTPDDSRQMRADFKATFNMGLSDLPVGKHGDALTWLRAWTAPPPESPATELGTAAGSGGAADPPTLPTEGAQP